MFYILLRLLRLPVPSRDRIILVEFQRDTVDTMPLIGRRSIALALEDVAQVSAAICAYDFCSLHAKRAVCMPGHRTGNIVEISRPSAARFELVVGFVERCVAAGACIDTGLGRMLVIFASEGCLGTLFAENAELFC